MAMLLSRFAIITKTKWDCCFQPCFGYDELFIWVQRKTKKEANKAYEQYTCIDILLCYQGIYRRGYIQGRAYR